MIGHDWPRPDSSGWWRQAACQHHQDLDWFPGRGVSSEAQRAICARCPVRTDCLEEALSVSHEADHGIWGGLTTDERRDLRARRNREAR